MIRSKSKIAIPPGYTVKEQLEYRKMSQKEFALRMNMSEKHISRLINGEVLLTTDMANRLEIVLGVAASFWNALEAAYRESILKIEEENSMQSEIELVNLLPFDEMYSLGWLEESSSDREKVLSLRKFFEVVNLSILDNDKLNHIACRTLTTKERNEFVLMAWAQRAKILARGKETKPINIKRAIRTIHQLSDVTDILELDNLRVALLDCGIVVEILPSLSGLYVEGATFYDGGRIVIALADNENKYYNLYHEIAHIVLGHIDKKNLNAQDEIEADEWAKNMLIDKLV